VRSVSGRNCPAGRGSRRKKGGRGQFRNESKRGSVQEEMKTREEKRLGTENLSLMRSRFGESGGKGENFRGRLELRLESGRAMKGGGSKRKPKRSQFGGKKGVRKGELVNQGGN